MSKCIITIQQFREEWDIAVRRLKRSKHDLSAIKITHEENSIKSLKR